MASGLITGAEWLDKLNFDVLHHILWFLDAQSILRLALTCKALNGLIWENRLVWLRSLQTSSIEEAAAPYSFDCLTTVYQIRKAATRRCRLRSALLSPTIPASLRVSIYHFSHDEVLGDKPASCLTPILLPGGRWLLTYAFDGRNSYVFCWDTFLDGGCDGGEARAIRPVAHCMFPHVVTDRLRGTWAQIQYEPGTKIVNIAIRFSGPFFEFRRIHYVLQMSWSESEPSRPQLTRRAMLDDDWHYLSDDGPREYSLEGDYVAIDSLSGILIWNWKEDTICTLLPEGHEWANGSGFLLNLLPPFIYIIPHELRTIVAARIPKLVPRGHSDHEFPSPQVVIHPFMKRPVMGLRHSQLTVHNKWLPHALRQGFATLTTHRARCMQQILRFPPANDPVAPPWFVPQLRQRFSGLALHLLNITGDDTTCIATTLQKRTRKARSRTDSLEVAIHAYPFNEANGNFNAPVSRTFTLDPLDGDIWSQRGEVGPICLTSGTILLAKEIVNTDSPWAAIVHYD